MRPSTVGLAAFTIAFSVPIAWAAEGPCGMQFKGDPPWCPVPAALERVLIQKIAQKENPAMRQMLESLPLIVEAHQKIIALSDVKPPLRICIAPGVVNACVTKAGAPLFVFSGLMEHFGTDKDALAWIIGHEVAHLARDHNSAQRYADAVFLEEGQSVAEQAYRRTRDPDGAVKRGVHHYKFKTLAFSREQEIDADDFGTVLMSRAGYKPDGATRALMKLWSEEGWASTDWRRTHPSGGERLVRAEPRIADETFEQFVASIQRQGGVAAQVRAINNWLRTLPDSGNGWFHRGTFLEARRRIEYVEAFEKAVEAKSPALQRGENELDGMWLSLCVGLYIEGHKVASANCSRRLETTELRDTYQRATFKERLVVGGPEPAAGSLSIARDVDGSKVITNDVSFLKMRGVQAVPVPAPWRGWRFPPNAGSRPLSGQ